MIYSKKIVLIGLLLVLLVLVGCNGKGEVSLVEENSIMVEESSIVSDVSRGASSASAASYVAKLDEINFIDADGYSCAIGFTVNKNPVVTIDTTQGKPGEVELKVEAFDFLATVRNTTAGKVLPYSPRFAIVALYPKGFDEEIVINRDYSDFTSLLSSSTTSIEMNSGEAYEGKWFSAWDNVYGHEINIGETQSLTRNHFQYSFVVSETLVQKYKKIIENPVGYVLVGHSNPFWGNTWSAENMQIGEIAEKPSTPSSTYPVVGKVMLSE